MAFQVGSIFARLELDTKQFTSGLNAAVRAANRFKKSVEKSFQGFGGDTFRPFTEGAKNAANTVAANFEQAAARVNKTVKDNIVNPTTAGLAVVAAGANSLRGNLVRVESSARNLGQSFQKSLTGPATTAIAKFGEIPRQLIGPFRQVERQIVSAGNAAQQKFFQPLQPAIRQVSRSFSSTVLEVRTLERGLLRIGNNVDQNFTGPFRTGLATINRLAVRNREVINEAVQKPLGAIRKSTQAASQASGVFRQLGTVIGGVGRGLGAIGTVGSAAFSIIRRGIQAIRIPIRFLVRSIFSIRAAIAVFGFFQFFKIAAEVDSITKAFSSLSSTVGAVSTTFLTKLRTAVRGTVSDLELMRITNNAVLLGVVETEEQFSELANVARRLGRAVGRGPTEAVDTLALGIGRQSRRILDNIGLIVRVEDAQKEYARSLGVSTAELTENEKRHAFLTSTMDAARIKMAQLGEDTLSTADRFSQFTASLANVFSDVAREFVGSGSLFSGISESLEGNRRQIRAFASAAATAFSVLFGRIRDFVGSLTSGRLGLSQVIAKLFSSAVPLIAAGVEGLIRFSVRLIANLISDLPNVLVPLIEITLNVITVSILKMLPNLILSIFETAVGIFNKLLDKVPFAGEVILGRMGIRKETFKAATTGAFDVVEDSLNEFVDSVAGKRVDLKLTEDLEKVISSLGQSAIDAAGEFKGPFSRALNIISGDADNASGAIAAFKEQFNFDKTDPLFGFEPVKLNEFLQPFEEIIVKAVTLREEMRKQLGPAFTDFAGRILKRTQDELIRLNGVLNGFLRTLNTQTFDSEKFESDVLTPLRQRVDELNKNIGVDLDASDSIQSLQRFQNTLEAVARRARVTPLTTTQSRELRDLEQQLRTSTLEGFLQKLQQSFEDIRTETEQIVFGDEIAEVNALQREFNALRKELDQTRASVANVTNVVNLSGTTFIEFDRRARQIREEWARVLDQFRIQGRVNLSTDELEFFQREIKQLEVNYAEALDQLEKSGTIDLNSEEFKQQRDEVQNTIRSLQLMRTALIAAPNPQSFKALIDVMQNVSGSVGGIEDNLVNLSNQLAGLDKQGGIEDATGKVDNLQDRLIEGANAADRFNESLSRLGFSVDFESVPEELDKLDQALQRVGQGSITSSASFTEVDKIISGLITNFSNLKQAIGDEQLISTGITRELQKDLESTSFRIIDLVSEFTNLRNELSTVGDTGDLQQIQQKFDSLIERVRDTTQLTNNLKRAIESSSVVGDYSRIETSLEELNSTANASIGRLGEIKGLLDIGRVQVQSENLNSLNTDIDRSVGGLKELKNGIESLKPVDLDTGSIDTYRSRVDQTRDSVNGFRQSLNKSFEAGQLTGLKDEVQTLDNLIRTASERLRVFSIRLGNVRNVADLAIVKSNFEDIGDEIENLTRRLTDLRGKLQITGSIDISTFDVVDLKERLKELEDQVARVRQAVNPTVRLKTETDSIRVIESEIQVLINTINELDERLDSVSGLQFDIGNLEQVKTRIDSLRESLIALQDQLRARGKVVVESGDIGLARQEIRALSIELGSFQRSLGFLGEIRVRSEDLGVLNADIQATQESLNRLEARLQLSGSVEVDLNQINVLQEEIQQTAAGIRDLDTDFKQIEGIESLGPISRDFSALSDRVNQASLDLEEFQNALRLVEDPGKIDEIRKRFSEIQSKVEEARDSLTELQGLERTLTLVGRVDIRTEDATDLVDVVKTALAELGQLGQALQQPYSIEVDFSQLAELEGQLNRSRVALLQVAERIDSLSVGSDLASVREDFAQLSQSINQVASSLDGLQTALRQVRDPGELEALEDQFGDIVSRIQETAGRISGLQALDFVGRVTIDTAALSQLDQGITQSLRNLERLRDTLDLSARVEVDDSELAGLRTNLGFVRVELNRLRTEITTKVSTTNLAVIGEAFNDLRADIITVRESSEDLQNSFNAIKTPSQLESVRERFSAIDKSLTSLSTRIQEVLAAQRVLNISATIDIEFSDLQDFIEAIDRAANLLRELDQTLRLERTITVDIAELESTEATLNNLSTELSRVGSSINVLDQAVDLGALRGDFQAVVQAISQTSAEIDDLRLSLQTIEDPGGIEELREKFARISARIIEVRREIDLLQQLQFAGRVEIDTSSVDVLQSKVDAAISKLSALQSAVSTVLTLKIDSDTLVDLETAVQPVRQALAELQQSIEDATPTVNLGSLSERFDGLRTVIENTRESVDTFVESLGSVKAPDDLLRSAEIFEQIRANLEGLRATINEVQDIQRVLTLSTELEIDSGQLEEFIESTNEAGRKLDALDVKLRQPRLIAIDFAQVEQTVFKLGELARGLDGVGVVIQQVDRSADLAGVRADVISLDTNVRQLVPNVKELQTELNNVKSPDGLVDIKDRTDEARESMREWIDEAVALGALKFSTRLNIDTSQADLLKEKISETTQQLDSLKEPVEVKAIISIVGDPIEDISKKLSDFEASLSDFGKSISESIQRTSINDLNSIAEVIEEIGINTGSLSDSFNFTSSFGPAFGNLRERVSQTSLTIKELISELGRIGDPESTVDLENLAERFDMVAKEARNSLSQIMLFLSNISFSGAIDVDTSALAKAREEMQRVIDFAETMRQALETGTLITINDTQLDEVRNRLNATKDSFNDFVEKIQNISEEVNIAQLGPEFTGLIDEIESVSTAIDRLGIRLQNIKTPEDLFAFNRQFERLSRTTDDLRNRFASLLQVMGPPIPVDIDTSKLRTAADDINNVRENIDKLDDSIGNQIGTTELVRGSDLLTRALADQTAQQELMNQRVNELLESAEVYKVVAQRAKEVEQQIKNINAQINARNAEQGTLLNQETEEAKTRLRELSAEIDELTQKRVELEFDISFDKEAYQLAAAQVSIDLQRIIKPTVQIAFDAQSSVQSFKDFSAEVDNFGKTQGEILQEELQSRLRSVSQQITLLDHEILKSFERGDTENVRNIRLQLENLESLQREIQQAIDEVPFKINELQLRSLTFDVTESILSGFVDAFARGESLSEAWADAVADIFRRSMQDSIQKVSQFASEALTSVFNSIGKGLGIGETSAGLVSGLLGITAGILTSLKSSSSTSIDNFESSINSSEAVRGVVAGPTNVAISQVGDQLKGALRTTELLLERIAVSVESGGPGSVSKSTGNFGNAFSLTPSSRS